MHPRQLAISNFAYDLPDSQVALYPLSKRDDAKLLIYREGEIKTSTYQHIADYIPAGSLLLFNNTKVIKARLFFQKASGAVIEIFLLEPYQAEYSQTFSQSATASWKCFIGGAAKWKEGELMQIVEKDGHPIQLYVQKIEQQTEAYIISFRWDAGISFAEILELAGNIPLPPYIKRAATESDKESYQTIYAEQQGSVAAPTAGLHFTENVFDNLKHKKIASNFVTLHVGAGTFKPVKAAFMEQHEMHAEWMDVCKATIQALIDQQGQQIFAVGTTSLRTMESLYWMGVKTILNPACTDIAIQQWDVYEPSLANQNISASQALHSLLDWMELQSLQQIIIQTQIFIAPGYSFRVANGIVTNFHQPQSTLLLLVAAAIGEDWKRVYSYALENKFRFLSYGDGSLIYFKKHFTLEHSKVE